MADVRLLRDGRGLEQRHGRCAGGSGRGVRGGRRADAHRLPPGRAGDRGRSAVAALPGGAHRRAGPGGGAGTGAAAAWRRGGVRPGVAEHTGVRRRRAGPGHAEGARLAAGVPDQLRRRPVRHHQEPAARSVRRVGHRGGSAQLQAGPPALQEVRREDWRGQGGLDSRGQQLGARYLARGPDGAALRVGGPGPHRAPRQARRPADHQHAKAARGGQGRERHSA